MRGEAALALQDDLPLLLLSAVAQPLAALLPYGCGTPLAGAALPVLWQCGLITVYRRTHQCGERSNAAFRRQSAAEGTSHAPHDSKARLQDVTKRRDSWRSHVHRTHTAQRVQLFELQTANVGGRGALPSSFLLGCKGDILFLRKRISPFAASPHGVGKRSSASRYSPCALRAQKETALAGCFPPAPEARKLSKLSIWDTYPHFPSFFFG